MAQIRRIVIVGAGLAGATAAGVLRERDFDGQIVLVGQEPHPPYELPPLSKGLLIGAQDEPDWVHGMDYYATHEIDLRTSTVAVEVRLGDHVVIDAAGVSFDYDRLLLATGSSPRQLPLPGATLSGVHLLRTLDDARTLRTALKPGARVVVIGAGWIGCEVAAAARAHQAEVTVIAPELLPLERVLGPVIGEVYRDLHAANGVTWLLGTEIQGFADDGTGKVNAVLLADGSAVEADLVVLGVGAAPRLDLATAAGLEIADGGVAVDATLRSSHPDVCAAGDIAAHDHPRYGRLRVEHWANAKDQGAHVAGTLLGETAPYDRTPYFFSDQYDLGMEYRGLSRLSDELVVRGDLLAREFTAFWLRDGRIRAAMNANMWDDGDTLQALVDSSAEVSPDALRTAELSTLLG